jgi:hypothetical protein
MKHETVRASHPRNAAAICLQIIPNASMFVDSPRLFLTWPVDCDNFLTIPKKIRIEIATKKQPSHHNYKTSKHLLSQNIDVFNRESTLFESIQVLLINSMVSLLVTRGQSWLSTKDFKTTEFQKQSHENAHMHDPLPPGFSVEFAHISLLEHHRNANAAH